MKTLMKLRWPVYGLAGIVVVGLAAVIYNAASAGTRQADGVTALIQYFLAIATFMLVLYTVSVAREAKRGTEQAAQDSLHERLDARGPRVTVVRGRPYLRLTKDGKGIWEGERYPFPKERRFRLTDAMDSIDLTVGVSFYARCFGDSPAFITIEHDDSDQRVEAAPPNGDRPTALYWEATLRGEEIRRVAMSGGWDSEEHGPLVRSIVIVTDATRQVEDRYSFETNWWPFEIDEEFLTIEMEPSSMPSRPLYVPAARTYHDERARWDRTDTPTASG